MKKYFTMTIRLESMKKQINSLVVFFLSLELILYCFNQDIYFQLPGLYIPLLIAVIIGSVAIICNIRNVCSSTFLKITIILLFQFLLVTLLNIDDVESGYFFSYVLVLILFIVINTIRPKLLLQYYVFKAYIYGALVISILQLAFKVRYYELTDSRLTIQLLNGPKIDPNYLAAYMVAPVFLCILVFYNEKKTIKKIMYLLYDFLLIIGVFLTGSRGALLSILCGAFFVFIFIIKRNVKPKNIVFFSVIIIVGIMLIVNYIPEETFQRVFINSYVNDGSNIRRIQLWENAINLIEKNPIIGYGVQSSSSISRKVAGIIEPAHNTFLDIWLQLGIVGIASVISYVIIALRDSNPILKGMCLSSIICSVFIGAEACFFFWINLLICCCFCKKSTCEERVNVKNV